jgi:hypothetical protein
MSTECGSYLIEFTLHSIGIKCLLTVDMERRVHNKKHPHSLLNTTLGIVIVDNTTVLRFPMFIKFYRHCSDHTF